MNIVAKHGCEIILGKTGENDATIVSFPIVYRFKDELGNNGTFTVLYKGPEDDVPYPCVTEVDGNNLKWIIKSPETRAAGYGQCEVMYTRSDGIKKSETFDTRVIESIGDEPGEVPEPQQSWVDMVVAAGATAEQAKQAVLALGVQARTVQPDSAAKVIKTTDSAGKVTFTFEIPKGVPGTDGVYLGEAEPTDPNIKVWIKPEGIHTDIPLYGEALYTNGDSICFGAGYTGGYGKCIADAYGMKLTNEGTDGATIATGVTGRASITTKLLASTNLTAADYILLEGGINDAWNGEAALGTITAAFTDTFVTTTTLGALEKCLYYLRTTYPKKKVGFVFPHGGMLAKAHAWNTEYKPNIKAALIKWGVPYIDLELSTPKIGTYGITGLSTVFTSDGTHPNKIGYETFYRDQIANFLKAMYSTEDMLEINRLKLAMADDYMYRQYVPKANFVTTKYVDWTTDYIEAEIDLTGCTNTSGEDVMSFGIVINEWKGYNFHCYYNCSTHALTVQLVDFNYATTATRTLTGNTLKIRVEKYKIFINGVQANEFNETVSLAKNTFDRMIAAGSIQFGSNNSGAVSNARYVYYKIGKLG